MVKIALASAGDVMRVTHAAARSGGPPSPANRHPPSLESTSSSSPVRMPRHHESLSVLYAWIRMRPARSGMPSAWGPLVRIATGVRPSAEPRSASSSSSRTADVRPGVVASDGSATKLSTEYGPMPRSADGGPLPRSWVRSPVRVPRRTGRSPRSGRRRTPPSPPPRPARRPTRRTSGLRDAVAPRSSPGPPSEVIRVRSGRGTRPPRPGARPACGPTAGRPRSRAAARGRRPWERGDRPGRSRSSPPTSRPSAPIEPTSPPRQRASSRPSE